MCVEEATNGDPSAIVGVIAHIEAKSDSGPRANPNLSDRQRDSYPNLILLCPNHHELVDARESTYTVEMLRGWKADREAKVREFLAREIQNITFVELEAVTLALVNNGTTRSDSMTLIPPQAKMDRNGLSTLSGTLINIGLVQSKQVQQYVETVGGVDRTFVTRLTSGFITEYQRNIQEGLQGDSLFEALRLFSSQGRADMRFQSAGLAVLVYLFERCEVFEQ
ncbi:MAG: HNH endonuclease [Chloroflexi bacterium]|nr:HNH endonuclease [Chloroflexota bacterium]MYE39493.1 HNH endonuclease [Chloroflexota bacterium]